MLQNLLSADVVIDAFSVNFLHMILSMSLQELKEIKDYYRKGRNIRIYHECEDGIEKSVLRITVCHHEACLEMTNADSEGQIFLSYPHTNNRLFFLLTTVLMSA